MDTTRLEKALADVKREVDYYGSAFPRTNMDFLRVALEEVPKLLKELEGFQHAEEFNKDGLCRLGELAAESPRAIAGQSVLSWAADEIVKLGELFEEAATGTS